MTTLTAGRPVLVLPSPDARAPKAARTAVAQCIKERGTSLGLTKTALASLRDRALLAVSELVTNAATHACGPTEVRVRFYSTGLLLSVTDGDPRPVVRGERGPEHGRGLALVEALTDGGVEWQYTASTKKAFCLLPYDEPDPAAYQAAYAAYMLAAAMAAAA